MFRHSKKRTVYITFQGRGGSFYTTVFGLHGVSLHTISVSLRRHSTSTRRFPPVTAGLGVTTVTIYIDFLVREFTVSTCDSEGVLMVNVEVDTRLPMSTGPVVGAGRSLPDRRDDPWERGNVRGPPGTDS